VVGGLRYSQLPGHHNGRVIAHTRGVSSIYTPPPTFTTTPIHQSFCFPQLEFFIPHPPPLPQTPAPQLSPGEMPPPAAREAELSPKPPVVEIIFSENKRLGMVVHITSLVFSYSPLCTFPYLIYICNLVMEFLWLRRIDTRFSVFSNTIFINYFTLPDVSLSRMVNS